MLFIVTDSNWSYFLEKVTGDVGGASLLSVVAVGKERHAISRFSHSSLMDKIIG
jgi:hypothetical protein